MMSFNDFAKREAARKTVEKEKSRKISSNYARSFDDSPDREGNARRVNQPSRYSRVGAVETGKQ